MVTAAFQP